MQEFTPEVTEDFYKRLAGRIEQRGARQVGQASEESLARGREGDPYEAVLKGAARSSTGRELSDLDADLAYRVAGLNREERLGKEGMAWQSEESEKGFNRQQQLSLQLARMRQDWEGDQASTANRREQQSAMWQLPLQVGGTVAGAYFGGPMGAAAGGAAGKKLGGYLSDQQYKNENWLQ